MITDEDVLKVLADYLHRRPEEKLRLAEPLRLLETAIGIASRSCLPVHATASALVFDDQHRVLLIEHLLYEQLLQPGGHIEPEDADLMSAALREVVEETGIAPDVVELADPVPVYVEFHNVPARPSRVEPAHHHLDFAFVFTTSRPALGAIKTDEVASAAWYPSAGLTGFLRERAALALERLAAASQRSG